MVPRRMKEFAKKLPGDIEPKYQWGRPNVPARPPIVARKYSEVKQLLAGSAFKSGVEKRLGVLTLGVQLNVAPVGPL
jgi:linoleate 10R-lipoxygenase